MKLKFIQTIMAVLALIFSSSVQATAQTAQQALDNCAKVLRDTPSITIKFTLMQGAHSAQCNLTMSKNSYCLTSTALTVWYDGHTQWAYNPSDKEVTITEPTAAELVSSNPLAIVQNYAIAYSVKKLADKGSVIEMIAKSKNNEIRKAVVTINQANGLPSKIVATLSSGHTFTATVTSVVKGKSLPASTFKFNKAKYPSAVINDLR